MIGVIRNGLNLLNVDAFYQPIVIGVVIVLAVELDVIRGRVEGRVLQAAARMRRRERRRACAVDPRRDASASARSSRSTASTSTSTAARCSRSSATTAPASRR